MQLSEIVRQLEALKAENAILRAKAIHKAPKLSFKVSEKGGVSVYGMGRFPVTLYAEQWNRLIQAVPELKAFIAANQSRLATK